MRAWLALAAALVLAIVTASVMLRLSQAGVGCEPWPACQAQHIAQPEATPPAPWHENVRLAHRVSATLAGIVFLFGVLFSWARWSTGERVAGVLLLALTAVLAVVGRFTPSASAFVVQANLLGGHLLLALPCWLIARPKPSAAAAGLALLVLAQSALGALVSQRGFAAADAPLVAHMAGGIVLLITTVLIAFHQGRPAAPALAMLLVFATGAAAIGWFMRTAAYGLPVAVTHSLLAAFALAAAAMVSRR